MGETSCIQSFAKAHTFPRAPISVSRKKSSKHLDRALAFKLTEIDLALSPSLFFLRGHYEPRIRALAPARNTRRYTLLELETMLPRMR